MLDRRTVTLPILNLASRPLVAEGVLDLTLGVEMTWTRSLLMARLLRAVIFIGFIFSAKNAFASCHVVTSSGSGSQTGADWNNAYAGLPATLTRGDIYYLADGSYSAYTFNTAVSGTTTVEIRKAQSYDNCTSTGWNTSTMGSSQAVMPRSFTVSAPYLIVNGNGTQTTQGCGGAPGLTMTSAPPNPTDCGFKLDNSICNGGADACDSLILINGNVGNYTFEYVELNGNGNNSSETVQVYNPYNSSNGPSTFTHIYGHNAGCVYFQNGATSRTTSFSYFWGTQSGNCHGQYSFQQPVENNGVEHDNIYRDITGTAIYTFANPTTGTSSGWVYYNNVYWFTTQLSGQMDNGIIACINPGVNCTNFTFVQNTIINCHYACGIRNENTGSYTVENNLWYLNVDYNGSPGGINLGVPGTEDYNSFLQAGLSNPGGGAHDVNDASALNAFVNWLGGNFNLASENADWTNRLALGPPYNIDPNGTVRTTDRGAYQFGSLTQAPKPPTGLVATVN
jgi:hypothetical protein